MSKARIFTSGNSQAVRLPKDVAWPENVKRVDVIKLGDARLLTPEGKSWDSFFASPGTSEDFMPEREQPPTQERESL